MPRPEMTLLQFVALTLPAVAILMQALMSFHERYGKDEYGDSLWTEFRFLELSFIGLVIAGGLFAFSIFNSLNSLTSKIALTVMLFSLLLLAPATWFALRRAKYPSESFDSPEDAVRSGLSTVGVLLLLLVPPALGGFLIIRFTNLLSQTSLPSMIANIKLMIYASIIFTILTVVIEIISNFYQYEESVNKLEKWSQEVDSLTSKVQKRGGEIDEAEDIRNNTVKTMNTFLSLRERAENLQSVAPQKADEDIISKLEDLTVHLNTVVDLLEEVQQLRQEKVRFKSNRETAQNTKEEASQALGTEELSSDELDKHRVDLERVSTYLDKVDEKLNSIEGEMTANIEDISNEVESIVEMSEEIQNINKS